MFYRLNATFPCVRPFWHCSGVSSYHCARAISHYESHVLASTTLQSIALNYIKRCDQKPPKALQKAINQLKHCDDIVITKPDKGSGVVVMDKHEYIRLLSNASINSTSKFTITSQERPPTRGRPPKHYHPLISKEKRPSQGNCGQSLSERFTTGSSLRS